MTLTTKIRLGFVAVGVGVGFMTSALTNALGLQEFKTPIWGGLFLLCFLTIFVSSYRERIKKSNKGAPIDATRKI